MYNILTRDNNIFLIGNLNIYLSFFIFLPDNSLCHNSSIERFLNFVTFQQVSKGFNLHIGFHLRNKNIFINEVLW
jgi:hypothetical protein